MYELKSVATVTNSPHITSITETWFIIHSNPLLPNYQLFHKNREIRGGRVAIYVIDNIKAIKVKDINENQDCKQIRVQISFE